MKKSSLLTIFLTCIVLLIVGCSDTQEEVFNEVKPNHGGLVVGYSLEHKQDIFGDLSQDKIDGIIEKILDEVAKDDNYKDNIDSIIAKVFKESGINDTEKIESAKSKLTISNNGKLTIKYDPYLEKEIFGNLSNEEIANIFMVMANEIYEDENYESNLDSIIEKVFRESGINDTKRIGIAKSTIKVSKSNLK